MSKMLKVVIIVVAWFIAWFYTAGVFLLTFAERNLGVDFRTLIGFFWVIAVMLVIPALVVYVGFRIWQGRMKQ